ncbi:MAG: glycosyltransferase family 2 protein [Candidatus Curtissbacteria bacterium]|nr:glycosyltransferase family 2 protein [Candidatus Curtissbacteria bacterium]
MDLSVVIVSYNTKELLVDCLKSVKVASGNLKAEVFVVDNNSRDSSALMVKKDFPWVKLIANADNRGFSKANNQAIKLARGKYVLILNPDTRILVDTFTKMIQFMDENPGVGVATCRVEFPNGNLDVDCRRHFPTPWRAFTHFSGLAKVFKGSRLFDQYNYGYLPDGREHEIDACVGAFMIIPKKAIQKVGMFDEDFFFYGEDLDWCWRFRENGYKIVYTPITKIIHYKGASSGIKKSSQEVTKATAESKKMVMRQSVRAMRIFYKKHFENKYPFFINWLMYSSMWLLEKYRLSRV